MLETHADAIIPSLFDSGDGLLEWRFVTQRFHAEWFYINQCFFSRDGDLLSRMLMIDDFNELESLLQASGKFSWVEDIYIVTPAKINQTGTWAIDLLLEMRVITPDPNLVDRNFIYRVNNSAESYFSIEVDGDWEMLPAQIVYQRASAAPEGTKTMAR